MKLKRGDTVQLMTGKDSGKSGKVLRIITAQGRLVVEGLNLYKKHVKPKRQGEKGETIQVARPVNAANARLVCKNCGRPTRIGYRIEESQARGDRGKNKKRYCKKCESPV